jgi:periplasmic protein TonB
MSRLHKKCFIASSSLHLLLALILLTCPAFLAPNPKLSDVQPITFFPEILLDATFTNPGGSPGSRPPAPTPTPPPPLVRPTPPAPEVRPAPQREPQKEKTKEVTPPETDVESVEISKEPAKKRPIVSTVAMKKPSRSKPASKEPSTADSEESQQRETAKRLLGQFDRTLGNIKSGTGSATKIEEGYGSGASGPSYASYEAWVLTVYDNAWVAPDDATSEDATVEVSVTIASDGTVVAKRIIKRSGDSAVDASVQRTLDRVNSMRRPFPEGSKDKERTYIIPFNMKTKRGTA